MLLFLQLREPYSILDLDAATLVFNFVSPLMQKLVNFSHPFAVLTLNWIVLLVYKWRYLLFNCSMVYSWIILVLIYWSMILVYASKQLKMLHLVICSCCTNLFINLEVYIVPLTTEPIWNRKFGSNWKPNQKFGSIFSFYFCKNSIFGLVKWKYFFIFLTFFLLFIF